MDRFKRLLVRFAKAAFDDDDLNKHSASIDVHISDGNGSHVSQEVVYWRNDHGVKRYAANQLAEAPKAENDEPADTPMKATA